MIRRISQARLKRFVFKNSAGTVLTTAYGWSNPLLSTYAGLEVDVADIKNTRIFIVPHDLRDAVAQGNYIHVGAESWLITGYKRFSDHSEFVGLAQGSGILKAFTKTTAPGIVSEWPFETSGSLLTDAQGLNNLSNVGSVAFSTDKPFKIPFLVGSAEFVAASLQQLLITDANQVGLDITGGFTFAFWLKLTTLPGTFVLLSKATTAPNLSYEISVPASRGVKIVVSNDGTATVSCNGLTILFAGIWYSIVFVFDGVDVRFYLDGALDTNASLNPVAKTTGVFNNNQSFSLGARPDAANFLNGLLAHVFVFNQPKTAVQVLQWHNTGLWT